MPRNRSKLSRVTAKSSLPVLLWMCSAGAASAATYYVAPDGRDSADGTSWQSALRTPQAAAELAGPGDTVIIRSGVYRVLQVRRSGLQLAPVTFRAEDSENPPVFSGAVQITNWSPTDTPGVWSADVLSTLVVKIDSQPAGPATTAACDDGRWFSAEGKLYFRPESGDPGKHTVLASSPNGIVVGANNWIVVEGLRCEMGNSACVSIKGGSDNVVRQISAEWQWRGINLMQGANRNRIESCNVSYSREGVYIGLQSHDNVVTDCKITRNGIFPYWRNGDRAGVAIGEKGPNERNIVRRSVIFQNGGPNSDAGLIAYDAPKTLFEDNEIAENFGAGVYVTIKSHESIVRRNRVIGNGKPAVQAGYKGIVGLTVRNGSHSTKVTDNIVDGNWVSKDSPWEGKGLGPRGGVDVRGLPTDDLTNLEFRGNTIGGTVGGCDFYVAPNLMIDGLIVDPVLPPCERPSPPKDVQVL